MLIGILDYKNSSEDGIILCIDFQWRSIFSFMLFLKAHTYKASFYPNVIKAQLQRSPTEQREYRFKNQNFHKLSKYFYLDFVYCVQFHK